jgi:PilZ domain-containing protein
VPFQNRKKSFGRKRPAGTSLNQTSQKTVQARIPIKSVRRHDRDPLWCECSVYSTKFGQEIVEEAVILDQSATGVRIRSRQRAALPEKVRIKAHRLGLNLVGAVLWQKDFDVGIVFDA